MYTKQGAGELELSGAGRLRQALLGRKDNPYRPDEQAFLDYLEEHG